MYKFPDALRPKIIAEVVCDALRWRIAAEIPDFREGAFAMRFVNKSAISGAWLGLAPQACPRPESTHLDTESGQIVGDHIDGTDLDYVFSVVKGGRKTRSAGWRDNPEYGEQACAGLAMMMIEGCARAVVRGCGNASENLDDAYLAPGCDNRPGALCLDVLLQQSGGLDQLIARIYVAVCGATDEENARIVRWVPDMLRDLFTLEHQRYPDRITITFPPSAV